MFFLAACLAYVVLLLIVLPVEAYLYRGDMLYFHAVEAAVRDAVQQGEWPLWNTYFAEPLLANPQAMVFYPVHALLRFLPIPAVMAVDTGFHLWLMVAALYLMLRDWDLPRLASMGAALAVGLSTLVVSRAMAGHVAQLATYPWAILAVTFYRRLLHRGRWNDLLLTVLAVAMIVLSGHTQQSITALLIPGCYFGYYVLARREPRSILRAVCLSALVGAASGGLLAVQLAPTLEYFPQTIRVDGFSLEEASWSALDGVRLLNLLTPFLPHEFLYAPAPYQEQTLYTSLMTFGLLVTAWRFGSPRYWSLVRYLAAVMVIVALLAMGASAPLFPLLFAVAPFLKAPGRFLQIWTFCSALLAGIGLEALLAREDQRQRIVSLLWFSVLLVAEIVVMLFVLDVYVFTAEPIETDALPLFLASLALVTIWVGALLLQRTKLTHQAWMRVFLGAIALDTAVTAIFMLFWPSYRIISESYLADFSPDSRYACIARQIDPRAVRLMQEERAGAEAETRIAASFGIPTLHEYSANLTYVRDLLELGLPGADLLAGSYLLADTPPDSDEWSQIHSACGLSIWQHQGVLPRIYAVGEVRVVPDTRQASLAAVQALDFDPRQSAAVSRAAAMPELPALPAAPLDYRAQITHYSANEIRAGIETSRPALVVLAEPYYPGWQATVNGAAVPIWRVNHALRGVMVGEGRHEIVFQYRPRSFEIGLGISLGTLALLGLGSLIIVLRGRRISRLRSVPPDSHPAR